jgi:RNA polymerase sigma-70 factor (TIGR02943 family)
MENSLNKTKIIESWVVTYSDELYSWAFYKTSSKETAEDLVQETFISSFKSFEKFEGRSQPKTWLMSILNNKIIDYYRKNAKTSFISSEKNGAILSDNMFTKNNSWKDHTISDLWNFDENSHANDEFLENNLKNCLSELPSKWNLAITYKYLNNKKAEEICQELEITQSNYWQIVHRAKLLLKKCVETKWNL